MVNFPLVFDDVMIKQLQKAAKNQQLKEILRTMLDELEEKGPQAGKLLDSHLFIYEIKNKHPPIRLYFKHQLQTNEIYVFEYEMKTSEDKQQRAIEKIRLKARNLKAKIFPGKFFTFSYIFLKIHQSGVKSAMAKCL
ncbi:MAG: hypothetical protein AB1668_02450 [Nanoarchaeota archaeon]